MKRAFVRRLGMVVVISLMLLAAALCPAAVTVTQPYLGVTYIQRTESSPRVMNMNIVQVDLTAPGIGFKVTSPGGTRETVRQTTLDYLNQQNAQVAINCHFFLPFPSTDMDSEVVGLAASQGNVYSPFEPQPIAAGYTDQSYAILPLAPALNIDAANHAGIVHRDASYADNKHVLETVTLWNTVSGSAQIVTNGARTIPTYSGTANGGLNPNGTYSDNYSWYSLARARTVIGLTQDNRKLILFTVDQAGGSGGMTPGEIADLLISDYGVYNALNLDGGGSTTLAMQDPTTHLGKVVNVSADNPLGRAVGSNLVIFAMPVPEPVSLLVLSIGGVVVLVRRYR